MSPLALLTTHNAFNKEAYLSHSTAALQAHFISAHVHLNTMIQKSSHRPKTFFSFSSMLASDDSPAAILYTLENFRRVGGGRS